MINKRQSSFWVSVVAIVLLNALIAGAAVFFLFSFARENRLTVENFQVIRDLAEKRANLEALEKTAAVAAIYAPEFEKYFVGKDSVNVVIERFESLAKLAKVSFRFARVEPSTYTGRPALSLSFSARGSFPGINHFLLLLENAPFKIVFNRVDLGLAEGDQWGANFDVLLTSFRPDGV